jgi:2-polyprenyl-3-methyl-5-hydroxy-6-metoxy-1,4-benzoquinol methylase
MDDKPVTRGHGLLEKYLAKKRTRMANKLIPSNLREGRILDIGCGTIPYFLLNTAFAEKCGLDKIVQTESHRQIQDEYGICLIDFDLEKNTELPFDSHYFDVVTMLAVIEHVQPSRLPTLIAEIWRVLKTGGMYVITTPAPWTGMILKIMAHTRLVSPEEISDHKAAYGRKTISSILAKNGFAVGSICSGYFEGCMNIWTIARKER